jgi:hypothetical protein
MKASCWIISLFCLVQVHAQYVGQQGSIIPVSFQYTTVERSGNALTINYDQSDETIFGVNYKRALFPIHKRYGTLPGQNLVYAAYTLDSLIKTDNSYNLPFANVNGLVLDSMEIQLGHVKHSGTNDTLFLSLLALDTVNFPGGTLLFQDTLVISAALSPGNVLTNTVALSWKPNYTMNNQPLGVRIEFTGSLTDTLALMSGYGIYPAPNACTDSSWDKARKSFFYPNSYAYYSNYNLLLPTAVQGDVFYNCDSSLVKDTADGESYIQNWGITSYVSAPEIGIEPQTMGYLTIYPNPAGNIIYTKGVEYLAAAKVYNGTGVCVKTFVNPASMDITDLNNGIYIFAFEYENKTIYKKVVVQR